MPSPIGYYPNALLNTPMNQISGVPSATYPTNLGATAPLATGLTNFTAQNLSASPGSTDYTQLSSATLMAIGQNPYAGQVYPQQGSIFNSPSSLGTVTYPVGNQPITPTGIAPSNQQLAFTSTVNQIVQNPSLDQQTKSALLGQLFQNNIQNDPSIDPQRKSVLLQQIPQVIAQALAYSPSSIGSLPTNMPNLLPSSPVGLPALPDSLFNVPAVQQTLPISAPFLAQVANTPLTPQTNLQQLYAQQLSAQILQITADRSLSPELKAVRIKDLQLQFQNLQVVANTGTNIQDQINQIANNPNIPPEAKQQLIAQLTGQIQQTNVDALAPQQPNIFNILLGGLAKQIIPSIVDPENPLVKTGLTLASVFLGTDLVTDVKPRKEDDSRTIKHPTATYEVDGETKTVETTVAESPSSNSEYLVA